ncbi:MAG: LON peptidase substrate-binding domain-containing protein [Planctomycetota bacterium]
MNTPHPDLHPGFDHTVRLFPLPDHVAFPRIAMPLHIFESRYLEMFEDAIAGDGLLALATLLPGHSYDYYSRAPIAPTVCIGRIQEQQKTDQGTYLFTFAGIARAEVDHEIEPVRSFRRAKVALLDETRGRPKDAKQIEVALVSLIKESLEDAEPLVEAVSRGQLSLPALTDFLGFYLPLSLTQKLELLSETDGYSRARKLMEHWPTEPREPTDPEPGFPNRFSVN